MEKIKSILRPFYIRVFAVYYKLGGRKIHMWRNFYKDYKLYNKYSIVFNKDSLQNKEADLTLQYHGLEKGFLYYNMKKGFAKNRVANLHKILKNEEVINNSSRTQIKVGYQVMCKYYELHQDKGYDIEDIYTKEQYLFYKSVLNSNYTHEFSGVIEWDKEKFYSNNDKDFFHFAHSRKSVRSFTGKKFPLELINKVIELANTAPSVCNRQASNVYLIEDKNKIDNILKVQGGFTGYTEKVNQLLIITNDRSYYYTIGERNQLYIDGGIYLMNLLYALHYYKIGNCPTHWGKTHKEEKKLSKVISLPESEKIIAMIPIGEVTDVFRTTTSARRTINENFEVLN